MVFPNFLIVGTRKGGTSSLQKYLRNHPDIFVAEGELFFFSDEDKYNRGIEYYESFFSNCKNERIIGEKSNPYMIVKEAPQRIREHFPKMKLIFLLRHPVERAYSGYWQNVRSKKTFCTFNEAIETNEIEYYDSTFIEVSSYSKQIKRFYKYFPKNQILIIKTEDLKNNRIATIKKVLEFLNAKIIIPKNINEEYNIGKDNRKSIIIHNIVKLLNKIIIFKGKYNPLRLFNKLISVLNTKKVDKDNKKKDNYPEMEDYIREYLEIELEIEINKWKELDY